MIGYKVIVCMKHMAGEIFVDMLGSDMEVHDIFVRMPLTKESHNVGTTWMDLFDLDLANMQMLPMGGILDLI